MTEPTPETPVTEPEPAPVLSAAELDRAINDAARLYIAEQRTRPRNPQRIADAKAELDGLIALRAALGV